MSAQVGGPGSTLSVSVLGTPSLVVDGAVHEVRGHRQAGLLALFVSELGVVLSREAIEDQLWAGRRVSAAALRVNVMRLRDHFSSSGFGDPFRTTARGYSLELAPASVDSHVFGDLAAAAVEARGRRDPVAALRCSDQGDRLWRGPAFHGVDDVPAIEAERTRLVALRHEVWHHRAAALIELGRYTQALEGIDVLLAHDPYREAAWALRMIALYRDQRQHDALATYRRLERLLLGELGIRPSLELQALEREVLEQLSSEGTGARFLSRELPGAGSAGPSKGRGGAAVPLVGRDGLVSDVLAALASHPWVTLFGLGGVGKTRVAREVVERLAGSQDRATIADLTTVADDSLVPVAIATALGLRSGDVPEDTTPLDQVADALRRVPTVLVLDNAEHVAAGARSTIEELRAVVPGLRVLVTSRDVLGSTSEVPLLVPPLTVVAGGEVAGGRSTAVELLELLLAERVSGSDGEALSSIAESVGGLPLGLELAATLAKVLPAREVADELERRGAAGLADAGREGRQRSLDAVLAWTDDHLAPFERQVFHRLSALPASFTLATAASVADVGETPLLPTLGRLVSHGLVTVVDDRAPARYAIPFLQRSFARARLAGSGQGADVEAQLVATMVRLVADEGSACRGPAQRQAFDRLGSELDTLRNLLQRLPTTGDWSAAADLSAGLAPFWHLQGHWGEGVRWARHVLGRAPAGEAVRCAKVTVGMAEVVGTYGGMAKLVPELHRAVPVLDAAGETAWAAAGHLWLAIGSAWRREGGAYHSGMARAREMALAGDVAWIELVVQRTHGLAIGVAGDAGTARRLLHRAARTSLSDGDAAGAAITFLNLGMFLQRAGQVRLAEEDLAVASTLASPLGMGWLVAHAEYTSAEIAADRGDAGAVARLSNARAQFLDLGDLGCANGCSRIVASVHLGAGDVDAALSEARTVLGGVASVDDQELAMVLAVVAEAYRRQGRLDDARALASTALERSHGTGIGLNPEQRRRLEELAHVVGGDRDERSALDLDTAVDLALA